MTTRQKGPAGLPQGRFRFVALDVETANGSSASICQIGLAAVTDEARIVTWSSVIDPRCAFSPFNIQLHGIGPDQVRGAPGFEQVLAWLEPLLASQPVIQHSSFDRRAVAGACEALGREAPPWRWGDSVLIARRAWPEFTSNGGHGLAHLKRQLDLRFHHHDAGEDARAAAEVVLRAEARTGRAFDEILGWVRAPG